MAWPEGDERPALTTAAAAAIRPAAPADAAAITLIYNHGIEDREATLETRLRTCAETSEWLAARSDRHPVLVAAGPGDEVWGWASPPWPGTIIPDASTPGPVFARWASIADKACSTAIGRTS